MPIRIIDSNDISVLVSLINRAYRPTTDVSGWTHEANWVHGERIHATQLHALMADPQQILLGFEQHGLLVGCVQVSRLAAGHASIGLLTVDPLIQTQGVGKQLLAAAEAYAIQHWQSVCSVMSVLDVRQELIAFYHRRGYRLTGAQQPYPIDAGVGQPKQAVAVLSMQKNLIAAVV